MTTKVNKQAAFFLGYMFVFGAVAISLMSLVTKGDVTGVIVLFLWAAFYYTQKKLDEKKIVRRKKDKL